MILQEDIKAILGGVQKAFTLSTLEPFINTASLSFKKEFGQELSNYITTEQVADIGNLIQSYKVLILYKAYSLGLPSIHVRVGDGGLAKNSPQNTIAITKWEYVKLEESINNMLDLAYENFYTLLDEAPPAVYTNSPSFIARSQIALNTAHLFTNHFAGMANSVRLFSKLKPSIYLVESELKQKVTPEVFALLTSSEYKTKLFTYIATLSLYEALPFLSVLIDSEGIRIVEKTDGTRNEPVASTTHKVELRRKLYNDSKAALEVLMQHLYESASPTVYPTFYNNFVLNNNLNISQSEDPAASPIL